MTDKEKIHTLLTVAPLLFQPPPAIELSQVLCPMTEAAAVDLTSAITRATALAIAHPNQSKKRRPRPQQGGCRITVLYLQELSDPEAQWAFWCISLDHLTINSNLMWHSHSMTGGDLLRLVDALQLPEEISTRNNYKFSHVRDSHSPVLGSHPPVMNSTFRFDTVAPSHQYWRYLMKLSSFSTNVGNISYPLILATFYRL